LGDSTKRNESLDLTLWMLTMIDYNLLAMGHTGHNAWPSQRLI